MFLPLRYRIVGGKKMVFENKSDPFSGFALFVKKISFKSSLVPERLLQIMNLITAHLAGIWDKK